MGGIDWSVKYYKRPKIGGGLDSARDNLVEKSPCATRKRLTRKSKLILKSLGFTPKAG